MADTEIQLADDAAARQAAARMIADLLESEDRNVWHTARWSVLVEAEGHREVGMLELHLDTPA